MMKRFLFFSIFAVLYIDGYGYPRSSANYQNLETLCRVWGFMKYYHPNITRGQYDWDQELIDFLPEIAKAGSVRRGNEIIADWVRRYPISSQYANAVPKARKKNPVTEWIHNRTRLGQRLSQSLVTIEAAERSDTSAYWRIDDTSDVISFSENRHSDKRYSERPYRLLSLFRLWNAVNYFFPYKDLMDQDWDEILPHYIPLFYHYENDLDYLLNCRKLIASLCDSHTNFILEDYMLLNKYTDQGVLPVRLVYVDGKTIVRQVFSDRLDLRQGDVIVKIDGRMPDRILDSLFTYYGGSFKSRYIFQMLRTSRKFMDIEYLRNDTLRIANIKLRDAIPANFDYNKLYRPIRTGIATADFKEIKPGIVYLNINKVTPKQIDSLMTHRHDFRAMIIDMRAYPDNFFNIYEQGKYFVSADSAHFATCYNADWQSPGTFKTSELRIREPVADYFKGPIVLLVNEDTISRGEFVTMGLQRGDHVITIGSHTAGCDGDLVYFPLPFGDYATFTGLGILYPDGTRTQRVGVKIDHIVYPTPEGIRDGRDELLEKAMEIVDSEVSEYSENGKNRID